MKTFHFPWSINLFYGKANTDIDGESIERKENDVLDSQNMRVSVLDGHIGTREKIRGEVVQYANIDNRCIGGSGNPFPLTYCCIANYQVLNHIVEFWADELGVGIPYVRVDGWVVLLPTLASSFPISFSYPPQVHGNDSCVGGEVFYTDNHNPPFILNVSDLLENAGVNPANNLRDGTYTCTTKYFSGFSIQQYQVQPPSQQDHPQFIEIVLTGSTPNNIGSAVQHGTGGMKVGQYQYAIQYVDSSGNTSNWSELTPLIPVPNGLAYSEPTYPSTNVFGGEVATVSNLGIHIRFRVTNLNNFASINIRRVTWNVNASLGSPPNDDSIIATANIVNGQIGIIDFYDYDNTTTTPITQAASTQSNLTAIQAAKGIRYYNSRLTLWNITYASRDLNAASVSFDTTNNTMYPFVRPLGVQGYKDIWNDVYRKSYFRGDKYGFALVGFDNNGNPSFALPIPGSNPNFTQNQNPNPFNNFYMPNRRDQLSGASLFASTEIYNSLTSPVPLTSAVNSTGNTVTPTYEVFDQSIMVSRDGSTVPISSNPKTIISDKNTPKKTSGQNPVGYNVFHPIKDSDTSNSFSYVPTVAINDVSTGDPSAFNMLYSQVYDSTSGVVGGWPSYNPKGFMPNMYALGMILSGVKNLPNWVSAFAIVRTAPANRVLAQGQGYYNFNPSGSNPPGYNSNNTNKDTNGMLWDSPDFLMGISPVNTILSNISRYKMQLVSPMGMFSEVYHGYSSHSKVVSTIVPFPATDGSYDAEIDMISYCRIIQDNGNFNPTNTPPTMAGLVSGGLNYTSFNSWRNSANSVTPNEEFPIGYFDSIFAGGYSVTAGSSPRRSCYYWKSSGAGIYSQGTTNGDHDYVDTGVRNWHEPLYVTNLVDDTQNVTQGLTQDYFQTGCYVKTTSIIGQIASSTTGTPSFALVDERWQDCIPSERSIDPLANQDRYVWIQDVNNNQFAWLNVTYKTAAQIAIIQAAIAANGFYVSTNCSGTVNCYGMYSHKIVTYTNGNLTSSGEKFYYINFDQKDNVGQNMIPAIQNFVIVKYDPCAPIEVFGGDTFIGDYTYPVADCVYDSNASPLHSLDQFIIDRPLPYRAWEVNENTLIVHNNDPTLGSLSIQQNNVIRLYKIINSHQDASYVRQLLCNGIVESRANTSLFLSLGSNGNSYVDSFFPNVNYVMRPIINRKWSKNIQGQFTTDYPDEATSANLGYGGFRINPNNNFDYEEYPTQDKSYSKPTSGFTEKLNFCTRCLWSDSRSTNEQNSPNLRNFPTLNVFDFDDTTGEIKRAWDSSVGKEAGNLYAFTETGIVMAMTEKNILTETSGQQLAVMGNSEDSFIQNQVWLSKSIGMNDQMWRSAAEYNNEIWWANYFSVYKLINNEIIDIEGIQSGYGNTIKTALKNISPGYGSDVTGLMNIQNNEYWLCINNHRVIAYNAMGYGINMYDPKSTPAGNYIVVTQDQVVDIQSFLSQINAYTINPAVVNEFYIISSAGGTTQFAYAPNSYYNLTPGILYRAYFNSTIGFFSLDTNHQNLCNDLIWCEDVGERGDWIGQFKYRFDKYVTTNNGNIYAQRSGATYLLDSGFIQNGVPVQAWVSQVNNPKEKFGVNKEFIRIKVNSNFAPDTVTFFQSRELYNTGNFHSQVLNSTPFAFKNYGGINTPGWQGYIPRAFASPFYKNQGMYAIYTIAYAGQTDWWVSSAGIEYKELKG